MSLRLFLISLTTAATTSLSFAQDEIPDDDHFRVETLAENLGDAMEIAVLPNHDIFIVERTGALKWFSQETGETKVVEEFDVSLRKGSFSRETGLLGIALDPNFIKNGWIYCYYSPREKEEHRLSRFNFKRGKLSREKVLLKIPQTREGNVCHEGGSLAFDSEGNLFISTGDNTCPFKSDGYAPLDEQPKNEPLNSQRSSSNSNDLRGKILRIRPTDNGKYDIPKGNLFPKGTPKTKPEIFVMGCRNPWRIGIDQKTNTLYWGDVGPDSRKDGDRGSRGYCEINQAKTPGNYGWPYFIADNKPYARYDFEKDEIGEFFDPEKPVNESRLNTGLEELPPARSPFWFESRSCYCAGPVYYYDSQTAGPGALPKTFDQCLITYDWNNGKMQVSKLGPNEELLWKKEWLSSKKFVHPSDVAFGSDGAMYVLEYSSGWYNGSDGKLLKITYSEEAIATEDAAPADPRLAGLDPDHPGTLLLAEATCLSCHQTQGASIGPKYVDVSARYRDPPKPSKTVA